MNTTLRHAFRLIVRPIVALALRHSLTLRDVVAELKLSFVDVAVREMRKRGEEPSSSKIAVMTGVHRADVTKILRDEPVEPAQADILTRVVGQWKSDRRFRIERDSPKPLTFEGKESEFSKLVQAVSRELTHYTVLMELERRGMVAYVDNRVVLQVSEFVAVGDLREGFVLAANDIEDILSSVEENILRPSETPHLHLRTEFDAIPCSRFPEIRRWLIDAGDRFHREAREYLSLFDLDITPREESEQLEGAEPRGRVSVGTFSYAEQLTDSRRAPEPRPTFRRRVRRGTVSGEESKKAASRGTNKKGGRIGLSGGRRGTQKSQ